MVLVALQDGLLDATFSELQAQFPKQTFRKVCVAHMNFAHDVPQLHSGAGHLQEDLE